ncbi:sensor histidine kinase [Clostridium sediminicola]|uniref:sensor histidine kinase n=1 Tax=Clostridium sediminicola TaxID=3114879 RepID=UPI0031F1FA2B
MKSVRVFNTLRIKLAIIAIILITFPIIAISVTYSRTVKNIIKNKYTETAIQSVYETGEKINFILKDIEEFSTVIISNENFLAMLNNSINSSAYQFNNKLRSFITLRNDIEAIDLIVNDEYYSIGVKKTSKEQIYYNKLVNSTGEPIWIQTKNKEIEILSGKFRKFYFTLARKIIDFNTLENYGYLMIDLEEGILKQAYTSLLDDDNAEIFICDKYGKIISHHDNNKIGESIIFEPYANIILEDKNGHDYVQYKTDIDKVAIYSTIESNGWKVIKTISTNYLYEEINRMQKYFIIGGVIYGFVIILFMILFSIRYTEPMINMMGVIKQVEQGDLTVRTEVKSNDEIGQLGDSLNNMIEEIQVLIERLIEEEQSKKELELEALHAQINPHFLYNTLNTIKWMAKIQGDKSVSKAITALIKLLRISINLGKDMISLREEIEYVKNYIVIQKLRFNESINMKYEIDEECLDFTVPKLILQPIVENSIIYGFEDERAELNIDIKVSKNVDNIVIEINDDGPGIETKVLKNILKSISDENKFSKVGLNNVNQRIKLYCGNEYGLEIETELGKGTKVIATLLIN